MKNLNILSKDLADKFLSQHAIAERPHIEFVEDEENSSKDLGRTAYYDPGSMEIAIYTSNRHVKDCLRSLAHELVHHMQNCRGDLGKEHGTTAEGYAQENDHLREMEREAYEVGNMFFRDWEDNLKKDNKQLHETIYKTVNLQGDSAMSNQDWKNKELNTLLMEKFGYAAKKAEVLNEELDAFLDTSKGGDYKTAELQYPADALEEEDEELLKAHPAAADGRMEKGSSYEAGQEDLEEAQLRQAIRDIIKEIS
jgi:hypothetical protein